MADDFDVEIQVQRQAANDLQLLVILAAEDRHMGPDDVEELGHHRRHAAEVTGAKGTAQRSAQLLDLEPRLESRRIDFRRRRVKQDIDAGFVWEPTLIKLVENNGQIVLSSRALAEKGYMTADLAVARRAFAQKYPDLVAAYVKSLSRATDLYRKDPKAAALAVAKEIRLSEAEALRQMKTMVHLNGKDHLGAAYLGTSSKKGGLAKALKDAADFLVTQKTIRSAPALAAFEQAVNPSYVERAMQ